LEMGENRKFLQEKGDRMFKQKKPRGGKKIQQKNRRKEKQKKRGKEGQERFVGFRARVKHQGSYKETLGESRKNHIPGGK